MRDVHVVCAVFGCFLEFAVVERVREMRPLLPDIDSLYLAVRSEQKTRGLLNESDPGFVPHSALLPELRQYQKMAVGWMIQREVSDFRETSKSSIFASWH